MFSSLDDLSASELNAAIDDSNFPKRGSLLTNGHSSSGGGSLGNSTADYPKHFLSKRPEYPSTMRMNSFDDPSLDVPGTPRTPRTSTTPGK